ncbi:MAG: flagellar hook-associated protein 2 [bacterium]|nr:MAG: flagellar hook-associated protein 2 [bacterium]
MAVTIDGLISGLDTASIITSLLELEKRPVDLLEAKQDVIDGQLSAWQEISTKLLSLETASLNINNSSKFNAIGSTFVNNNALQGGVVNVLANDNVITGSNSLSVYQIATQQKIVSDQGFGSTTQNIGHWSTTITTSTGTQTFYQTTLDELKSAINSSGLGVTASIINTSSTSTPYYRLQVTSNQPGVDNGFDLSVNQGLTGLGDPGILLSFSTMQQAQDAIVALDGITVTRSTNVFSDLIEGVELELLSAGSGTITFSTDTSQIVENMGEFVDAYNNVMGFIREQLVYNPAIDETGPLFGNSTLLVIQTSLTNMVTGVVSGLSQTIDPYTTLSQVGIYTELATSKLVLDSNSLVKALTDNFEGVRNLFVPAGSGTYTFVTAGGSASGGTYDTRVTNSGGNLVVQMRAQGSTGSWITLEQTGNYWDGPPGTVLEGLSIRAANLADGQTGTMSFSTGVAEQISYRVGFITEYSTESVIYNQLTSLETRKDDYQDQIDNLNLRIERKRVSMVRRYAQLEVTLAQLKSQSSYLTQQFESLLGLNK